MATGANRVLWALAVAIDGLAAAGLHREPVQSSPEVQWWRRSWRSGDVRGTWTWARRAVEVPVHCVALCFGLQGDVLQWVRGGKGEGGERVFDSGVIEPAGGHCPWLASPHRPWWHADPQVHEVAPPAGVTWGALDNATTGRVLTLLEVDGAPAKALLLLAKQDVRYRRLGLWGLRAEFATRLSEPFATLLTRGRAGELRG